MTCIPHAHNVNPVLCPDAPLAKLHHLKYCVTTILDMMDYVSPDISVIAMGCDARSLKP